MKKNYLTIILSVLLIGGALAQEVQKNFINYQGVARNSGNQLMTSEAMTINIAVKFGAANAAAQYVESHSIMTDANGVFSLLIGNGKPEIGNYNMLPWGSAATFVTVSMNGNEVGTTELMAVPYAISAGNTGNRSAEEVLYDNSMSGLTAKTAQEAIDELATGGSVDADSDPANELQTLSFDVGSNELSLSDGNSVTIPTGGTDADADPTNELQTLSFDPATNKIVLSDGGEITIPSGGADADADPTNEIQTISFDATTNQLSLSDGGSVTIPSGGTDADADPENEIDVTRRHGLLIGDDGIVDGLIGTADGQVAKWDAVLGNWVAGTDDISVEGVSTSTGFEALNEGGGLGWRLINRNDENYGPIGLNALDASINSTASTTRGATGLSAIAMGEETTASGPRSIAMGFGAKASGSVSMAVGEETEASGEFSVAMGDRTLASEQSSTAFGAGTRATNTHATAMGESTTASGKSATSMGIGTRAESLGSFVIGRNNIGGGNAFEWRADDPLFEVGNGGNLLPNNALTVLKNGKVGIGTYNPMATLHVHADSFESNTRYTTEDLGDGTGDGFYVGLVNDFGFGPTGEIMNEEKGPLRLGTYGVNHLIITQDGKVGVGVSNPSVKFEVDGEIRSTNLTGSGQRNVMADADGNLVIGVGSGSSSWAGDTNGINFSTGNVGIGVVSSSNYPLNVLTDNERPINLTTTSNDNYIAFNNSDGYKGYAGVFTGNSDMDFGTGFLNVTGKVHLVTNAIPKLTVTAAGNVGIGTQTPTATLDVRGDIKTSSEVQSTRTGTANLLPYAYGVVSTTGDKSSGTDNFTVSKTGEGSYQIRFVGARIDSRYTVALSRGNLFPGFINYAYSSGETLLIATKNIDGVQSDNSFSFIIYKP